MIDLGLLAVVLIAAAAGGLVCLRALAALPAEEAEWLVPGVAVGLGMVATVGLGLAELDVLRPVPIALVGLAAVVLGRKDLGGALARFRNGAFGVLTGIALGTLARRHLGAECGPAAGALFFTLPITWSMMTHAGSDLPVVLYAALATAALFDWRASGRAADVR